jgi:hypothetical protein
MTTVSSPQLTCVNFSFFKVYCMIKYLKSTIVSLFLNFWLVDSSVADPDPNTDPSDPYVFRPPGSGSGFISQRYGSGSGSFYHQSKIVRKTLILLFCDFFLTFYFEKLCKCTFKK